MDNNEFLFLVEQTLVHFYALWGTESVSSGKLQDGRYYFGVDCTPPTKIMNILTDIDGHGLFAEINEYCKDSKTLWIYVWRDREHYEATTKNRIIKSNLTGKPLSSGKEGRTVIELVGS